MRVILFILLIVFELLGANNLESQEIQSKSEKAFSRVKLRSNKLLDINLMNDHGKRYKARVSFPDSIEKHNPLIIALHYAGGLGTYKEFHDCLVVPGLEKLNAIIISPEGEEQLWSTENNIEKILSIVNLAPKYWKTNQRKVVIMGYSNGGNGTWYFAKHYPDLFSAAIPIASSYPLSAKIQIPVYAIHGSKDELFSITKTEKYINNSIEKGSNITFIKNERLSHFQACAYAEDLKKVTKWLHNIWNIE